eukprot:m.864988 g.864988  ORF g.864988 m.864988 type:complete len:421 (+) comp23548_c0_seq1:422-1684(+)
MAIPPTSGNSTNVGNMAMRRNGADRLFWPLTFVLALLSIKGVILLLSVKHTSVSSSQPTNSSPHQFSPSPMPQKSRVAPDSSNSPPPPLHFYVVGDWGTGGHDQHAVARAMDAHARHSPPQFVLSPGDQIYHAGVETDVHDPILPDRFDNVFTRKYERLRVPWYMTLGNHDCMGNISAQIAYTQVSKYWNFPAEYYTIDLPVEPSSRDGYPKVDRPASVSNTARIIVLDTCSLVCCADGSKAHQNAKMDFRCDPVIVDNLKQNYDVDARDKQLAWLDRELAVPATYKVVLGHWPVFSFLGNGPSSRLAAALLPRVRRHGVDVYFSGHDHGLQHIHASEPRPPRAPSLPEFFVVGGGGYPLHAKGLKPDADRSTNHLARPRFAHAMFGFADVKVIAGTMHVDFIAAANGSVVYSVAVPLRS